MSIEPIGRVDSNTTSLIELLQVFQVHSSERHSAAQEVNGLSFLTAGDRDLLITVYGPDVLVLGNTAAERIEAPQFLLDVIEDRKNGQLPIGTELTSTYVQARFDAHARLGESLTTGLTEQNLLDARAYFHNRVNGEAIDLQA